MGKIKLNLDNLNKAIQQAFDETVEIQSDYFDEAIASDTWEWPRQTIRSDGSVVSSPRDIVDTEELLDSKVIIRSSDGTSVQYDWEADHALAVHEGATTQNGTDLPARPWTQKAIEECQPQEVFNEQLKKRL